MVSKQIGQIQLSPSAFVFLEFVDPCSVLLCRGYSLSYSSFIRATIHFLSCISRKHTACWVTFHVMHTSLARRTVKPPSLLKK